MKLSEVWRNLKWTEKIALPMLYVVFGAAILLIASVIFSVFNLPSIIVMKGIKYHAGFIIMTFIITAMIFGTAYFSLKMKEEQCRGKQ